MASVPEISGESALVRRQIGLLIFLSLPKDVSLGCLSGINTILIYRNTQDR